MARKVLQGLALARLCLAMVSASVGAPLLAAEIDGPLIPRTAFGQHLPDIPGSLDDPAPVDPGGALYSPFSRVVDMMSAAKLSEASARPPQDRLSSDEAAPDLAATTIAAIVAAGFFVYLVRLLWTV